jgi:hypothetical protein
VLSIGASGARKTVEENEALQILDQVGHAIFVVAVAMPIVRIRGSVCLRQERTFDFIAFVRRVVSGIRRVTGFLPRIRPTKLFRTGVFDITPYRNPSRLNLRVRRSSGLAPRTRPFELLIPWRSSTALKGEYSPPCSCHHTV